MQLQDLAPIAVAFVIVGVALGIGANITANVQSYQVTGSVAWAAAGNSTAGIGEVAEWLPTIGLIIAAAVIIGILFSAFYGGGRAGGKR